MTSKLKLRDVLRMLRDKDGWRPVRGRIFNDEITYRDTGFVIYADCDGVAVRRFIDPDAEFLHLNENVPIVYEPNIFAFILTTIYTTILRHHLRRTGSACATSGAER